MKKFNFCWNKSSKVISINEGGTRGIVFCISFIPRITIYLAMVLKKMILRRSVYYEKESLRG